MKLIALCYFVLSLFGCDIGASTFVTRTSVDGRDVLYSKATTRPGIARFECVRSASGQCHYTLFARDCTARPGASAERCRSEPVKRFAIATGGSRRLPSFRRLDVCVSADGTTRGRDCKAPVPIAAR